MINVLKAWELMRKQWLGNIVKKEKVRIKCSNDARCK